MPLLYASFTSKLVACQESEEEVILGTYIIRLPITNDF